MSASQRLQDRIKQHATKSIRSGSSSLKRLLPSCRWKPSILSFLFDSIIELYLLQTFTDVQHFNDRQFSVLAQDRSPFHLSVLEATFIKTSNFALCRQKEFVYSLKIAQY